MWWFEWKCPLQVQMFESLVLGWWCCLGRLRRYGLARGNETQEADFEVPKPHAILSSFSRLLACSSRPVPDAVTATC